MIDGVSKVVIEVGDQDRALAFWTERLGFPGSWSMFTDTEGNRFALEQAEMSRPKDVERGMGAPTLE